MSEPLNPRQQLLDEARKITSVDRNKNYGNPEDNFQNIADYWNVYLRVLGVLRDGVSIKHVDVAYMMALMKLARLNTNATHHDSLVDLAGYAACAADCQEVLRKGAEAVPVPTDDELRYRVHFK